jgi:hypothetical protein
MGTLSATGASKCNISLPSCTCHHTIASPQVLILYIPLLPVEKAMLHLTSSRLAVLHNVV